MERKDYRYFLPFFFFLQFYSVTTLSLYILIARRYIQSVLTIRNYSGMTGTTMYVFSRATIILYPSDIKPTLVSFALIAV